MNSLRANLLAAVATAIAALLLTLWLLADPLLEQGQIGHARQELRAAASAARGEIEGGGDPDAVAERVGARTATHITVVDSEGRLIGDTALDGEALQEAAPLNGAQEIIAARRDGTSSATREEHGKGQVYAAVSLRGERVVRAGRPIEVVLSARASSHELLVVASAIAILTALLLAWVLGRTLVGPVEALTRVTDALARGDLAVRTGSEKQDELGRLGRAVDRMADELQERLAAVHAERARLGAVLDSMVEAVLVVSPETKVVLTNRALADLIGKDITGRRLARALPDERLGAAIADALAGRPSAVQIELRSGRETRALAVTVAPLSDGGGAVAVLHDVTELERADRIRRDFVANASHELRTPLTAIRGFAETLRDGAASDPVHAGPFLDKILRHTGRLERLVEDLLVLSRAESADQRFDQGTVSIGDIAAAVISDQAPRAASRHVALEAEGLEALPAVRGTDWAFEQLLGNLVDNAVKYTPEGGRATVRGSTEREWVVVDVVDTGPGIPPAMRERVFERFYRLDEGRSRDLGGTGLGLSIVKHLAQRMGAEVTVLDADGGGSVFRVKMRRA